MRHIIPLLIAVTLYTPNEPPQTFRTIIDCENSIRALYNAPMRGKAISSTCRDTSDPTIVFYGAQIAREQSLLNFKPMMPEPIEVPEIPQAVETRKHLGIPLSDDMGVGDEVIEPATTGET